MNKGIVAIVFFLVSLCVLLPDVNAAVMGIDFGSEFYKISMIAAGKSFVILENTFSHRKTHSAISFTNEDRLYEAAAASRKVKYPESTFWFIQKFLAALESDKKIIEVSQEFYEDYLLETDMSRKTINFKIPHFHLQNEFTHNENGDFILTTEEVLAMILIHAKQLAEKQIDSQIRDCVFTIPSNWDLPKRQALYVSAQLANLTVLSFIKENTAAALAYGFERQDVNASHLALFYNLGSSSVKVSLVEYSAVNVSGRNIENIKVLADETYEELSTRHLDLILAKHLAIIFDELPQRKGKESILTYRSNFRRLLNEASKFKEVLSANKEAFFYVESLLSDIDFRVFVERATFEEKSKKLIDKVNIPIERVLAKAKKNIEDIDAIEIIGGGVRIPMIQTKLTEFLKDKQLGAHLNGDEAMSMGAVFQAANYSTIYRVRPIWLYDGFGYSIRVIVKDLETGEVLNEEEVYEAGDYYGKRKNLQSSEVRNLQFIFERNVNGQNYEAFRIYNFSHIVSLHEVFSTIYKNITQFHVEINTTLCSIRGVDVSAGLVFQTSKMQEFEEYVLNPEEPKVDENNSTESDSNATKFDNSTESQDATSDPTTNSTASNRTESQESIENGTNFKPILKKTFREVISRNEKRLNYTVWTMEPHSLTEEEMVLSRRKIVFLNEDEELRKKTAQAKNSLEELIYKVNDYNSDDVYLLVSNETQREPINQLAEENRNWLESDEGFSANYNEYNLRYQQIHNLTNLITWRMEEYKLRPTALNDSQQYLNDWEKTVAGMNVSHPWISHKERGLTLSLIRRAKMWLSTAIEQQNNSSLYDPPVVRVYELSNMLESVGRNVTYLKNLRPPKHYYEDLIKKMNFNFTNNDTKSEKHGEEPQKSSFSGDEDVIDLDSEEEQKVPNQNENSAKNTQNEKEESHSDENEEKTAKEKIESQGYTKEDL